MAGSATGGEVCKKGKDFMFKLLATTAVAATIGLAGMASAVTVAPGFDDSFSAVLDAANPSATFNFEPTTNQRFFFSTSGSGQSADLMKVTYGFIDGTAYSFDFVEPDGAGPESALGDLPDIETDMAFYVEFLRNDGTQPVGVTLSVTTEAVSDVPLPAGAVLLLTGLAGLGLSKRRKAA